VVAKRRSNEGNSCFPESGQNFPLRGGIMGSLPAEILQVPLAATPWAAGAKRRRFLESLTISNPKNRGPDVCFQRTEGSDQDWKLQDERKEP
jgi:hypothetical protein